MSDPENNQGLSQVEAFFYAAQKKLGGNLQWSDLQPQDQIQFVQACNILTQICSFTK